jgi:anti-anti-sigma regulatory factor
MRALCPYVVTPGLAHNSPVFSYQSLSYGFRAALKLGIKPMLMIETKETGSRVVLHVVGRLAGSGVAALEECWCATIARCPKAEFAVDLTEVAFIDRAGSQLLRLMDRDGVAFVTTGLMTEELKEILERNWK